MVMQAGDISSRGLIEATLSAAMEEVSDLEDMEKSMIGQDADELNRIVRRLDSMAARIRRREWEKGAEHAG